MAFGTGGESWLSRFHPHHLSIKNGVNVSEIIDVKNLTFTYSGSETPALKDISFSIEKGQFVAVVGPTGAGKSTLCYSLNGVVPRLLDGEFQGSVVVNGLDTFENDIPVMAQYVGLVVQNARNQLFNVTVETEVAFGCENLGIPRDEIRRRITRALEFVKLEGYEKREPAALSGGQQQRIAIACVLAMEPEVLVLDEPTSELDPLGSEQVMEVIARLNNELGKTVFLVTHNSEFVAQYADRVLVVSQGSLINDGAPRQVFSQEELIKNANVRLPQVSEIAFNLRRNGLPIDRIPMTLDEASVYFEGILNAK